MTKDVKKRDIEVGTQSDYGSAQTTSVAKLGEKMLLALYEEDKSILVSPLSVMYAMSMAANGADGNTLAQFNAFLFDNGGVQDQNAYLRLLSNKFSENRRNPLELANSLWIRDNFSVERSFVADCVDYYDSEVFKVRFDDSTVRDINNWISEKTNGKIDDIIDTVSEDTAMYIINTLCFDGTWQQQYESKNVQNGTFTVYDGEKKTVKMMTSMEDVFLDDGKAKGFLKPYMNSEYAFIAMMPNEDLTLYDYIKELDITKLLEKTKLPENTAGERDQIIVTIPKFKYEYETDLKDALRELGITDAFVLGKADFKKLSKNGGKNVFINKIDHNCTIKLDEYGSYVSAATKVELMESMQQLKNGLECITFDRPFFYMIVECSTLTPIFVGTVVDF